MRVTFLISVIAAGITMSACGDKLSADQSEQNAAAPKPGVPAPLSTARIDVRKTQQGMVAPDFDPCVYAPLALAGHFRFPVGTKITVRKKTRSCFYDVYGPADAGDFTRAALSLTFDNGRWKNVGDLAQYDKDVSDFSSKIPGVSELSNLGARTFKANAPQAGASQMLLGFPVGGSWSATLQVSPKDAGADTKPYFDRLYALAGNLNSRLSQPSTVTPQ